MITFQEMGMPLLNSKLSAINFLLFFNPWTEQLDLQIHLETSKGLMYFNDASAGLPSWCLWLTVPVNRDEAR